MALGSTPKHTEEISFDIFSPQEFLALALETTVKCDWELHALNATGFRASTASSAFSSGEEITLLLHEGGATFSSESKGKKLIDKGQNRKNAQQFLSYFNILKNTHSKSELEYSSKTWELRFSNYEGPISTPQQNKKTSFDVLRAFIPSGDYFVTPILISINVLIFLLMCLSGADFFMPDVLTVMHWGGNYKPSTLNGEWWRMMSACFLHFGIFHLAFNMYALSYIGMTLEPQIGRLRFLFAYLLTGLTSSIASLWWNDNGVSAGASGAIFGMYGVFFALLSISSTDREHRKDILKNMGVFLVYNLVFGAAIGADNAGHIGGLLGGLLIGCCFYFVLQRPQLRVVILSVCTASILGLAVFAYNTLSNPMGQYLQAMEEFSRNEKQAIENYEYAASPEAIRKINEGTELWEKNIKLLKEVKSNDLPSVLLLRINLLIGYCEARIKFFSLAAKDLESSDSHESQLELYNDEIRSFLVQIEELDKKE